MSNVKPADTYLVFNANRPPQKESILAYVQASGSGFYIINSITLILFFCSFFNLTPKVLLFSNSAVNPVKKKKSQCREITLQPRPAPKKIVEYLGVWIPHTHT